MTSEDEHRHTAAVQLQLNLWDWLDEAAQVVESIPELIAVADGITALDSVLETVSDQPALDQLALASEAFVQLSDLLERKSRQWLDSWQRDRVDATELSEDWSTGIVRQPVSFDLSDLVANREPPLKPKRIRRTADSSLAAPVDPERLLALLTQLHMTPEAVQAQLLNLAGNESPTDWGNQIATAMQRYCGSSQHSSDCIPFTALQQATGLSTTELWLGLLLGGYILQPPDRADLDPDTQFYQLPDTLQIQCALPADISNSAS